MLMREANRLMLLWFAPLAYAAPIALAQCGGSGSTNIPDASTGSPTGSGNGGGIGGGSGSIGASSGSMGSSGGVGGGDGAVGSSGSSGGRGTGSNGGSAGNPEGGTAEAGPAPILCTSPGVPAGCVQCVSDSNCPTSSAHCFMNTCVQCVT